MTSKRPPKPTPTVEIDAVEVARLAAASVPCAGCIELTEAMESLRRFRYEDSKRIAKLEQAMLKIHDTTKEHLP